MALFRRRRTRDAAPPSTPAQNASLLSDPRRRDLDRIGREYFGPPYPGPQPRVVQPDGASLLLEAADAMGIAFPIPGSAHWREYETRLCTDLLAAARDYGGWSIAGALYVALDLDTASQNGSYLEIIDRASWFLRDHEVPSAYIPPFVLNRWTASHGGWSVDNTVMAAPRAPEPPSAPAPDPSSCAVDVRSRVGRPDEDELRAADRAGDAAAARALGMSLRRVGDIDGAEDALRRAEERGDVEAIIQLAYVLEDDRGDMEAAELAWRRADDAGSVDGSMMLGVMLRGRGANREAAEAFARAEARGHKDAAASIGSILEDEDDHTGAEAAYRRADARGSIFGAFNLGLLLVNGGDLDGAQVAWQNADERGDAEGAANLGSLLRERGDPAGAEAAYRRADKRGSALGAWQLGEMLEARGDLAEAQVAYERAADRDSPPGAFALARVHLLNDDVEAGRHALARAAELGHPQAPDLLADLARLEPSQPAAGRALFMAAGSDDRVARAKAAYDEGLRLADDGQLDEARDFLVRAAALCAQLDLDDESATCDLHLSHSVYMVSGDLQQARAAGQRAVDGFRATGNHHARAQAAMVLGVVCEESGDARQAIELYELTTAIGEAPMADRALLMKGRVLKDVGQPAEAREVLLDALAIAETKGDAEAIADNKRELGIVCERIDGPEVAERYHVEAGALFADLDQPRDVADCEANLGVLYANTERFEAAEHHMLNARLAYTDLGLDERAARTLRHLGNVYRNTKRPVLSRQANEEALQINERLGNRSEAAHCTRNIGAALNMQRDYEGAETYFLRARDLFRRLGAAGQEANCEDLLRLLYTHLGRTADAHACASRSAELTPPG